MNSQAESPEAVMEAYLSNVNRQRLAEERKGQDLLCVHIDSSSVDDIRATVIANDIHAIAHWSRNTYITTLPACHLSRCTGGH